MRVERMTIQRFRSIANAKVDLHEQVTAVVGENNAGKSTILRALRVFFHPNDELEALVAGKHLHTDRSTAKVGLTFSNVATDPKLDPHMQGSELFVQMRYKARGREPSYFAGDPRKPASVDKSVLQAIARQVRFVYIPPNREPRKLAWDEATLLRRVVGALLEQHTHLRDAVSPKFRKAADHLNRNGLSRIAKQLHDYYPSDDVTFSLAFRDPDFRQFLVGITLSANEMDRSFDISEMGTGIQSLAVIALHRLLASLEKTDLILGIDEPETSLHPQAQRELIGELTVQDKSTQVVLTTHSPVAVDQLDHTAIALARKVPDQKRSFVTVVSQVQDTFWTKNKINKQGYLKFYRYRNSDFVFSRAVVLVEGTADADVIRELMRQKDIDISTLPVSIIHLGGVKNLKYTWFLLKQLDLPTFMIVDKDYFVPYLNGSKKASRDGKGFLKYNYAFQPNCLVTELIPSATQRSKLLGLLRTNHSRALDLLGEHNIVSMKYSLEVDLVASAAARDLLYKELSIRPRDRHSKHLLVDQSSKIKRPEVLLSVLSKMKHRNLPNSYKRIKRELPAFIGEHAFR